MILARTIHTLLSFILPYRRNQVILIQHFVIKSWKFSILSRSRHSPWTCTRLHDHSGVLWKLYSRSSLEDLSMLWCQHTCTQAYLPVRKMSFCILTTLSMDLPKLKEKNCGFQTPIPPPRCGFLKKIVYSLVMLGANLGQVLFGFVRFMILWNKNNISTSCIVSNLRSNAWLTTPLQKFRVNSVI